MSVWDEEVQRLGGQLRDGLRVPATAAGVQQEECSRRSAAGTLPATYLPTYQEVPGESMGSRGWVWQGK